MQNTLTATLTVDMHTLAYMFKLNEASTLFAPDRFLQLEFTSLHFGLFML
jgi:hypothetical protein